MRMSKEEYEIVNSKLNEICDLLYESYSKYDPDITRFKVRYYIVESRESFWVYHTFAFITRKLVRPSELVFTDLFRLCIPSVHGKDIPRIYKAVSKENRREFLQILNSFSIPTDLRDYVISVYDYAAEREKDLTHIDACKKLSKVLGPLL